MNEAGTPAAAVASMYNANRPSPDRRFLVVTRVGIRSLHSHWLVPDSNRSFDVLLSAYDPAVYEASGEGILFEYRRGRKVAGYNEIFKEHMNLLRSYDYVAFLDEDLLLNVDTLNGLFAVCTIFNVKIAQPSLTADSYFTYAALLQQPGLLLRFVNFIEMMAPIFRSDTLPVVAPLFDMGFESGIDLIWCNLVAKNTSDFAVIDAFPVRHTEPVGSRKQENGFEKGRMYEDDIYRVLRLFNLPWISALPYAGVTKSHLHISGRLPLFLSALTTFRSVVQGSDHMVRLRAVLVHLHHIIKGRAGNQLVQYPER